MEFKIENNNLIVSIPLKQTAYDYFGEECGKIENIIGVISKDESGNDEMGFYNLNDMTYAGKEPQIGGLMVYYWGSEKDFIDLCLKLDIDFYRYPVCDYCKKVIYGTHTIGDKGNMCFDCEDKEEEKL